MLRVAFGFTLLLAVAACGRDPVGVRPLPPCPGGPDSAVAGQTTPVLARAGCTTIIVVTYQP